MKAYIIEHAGGLEVLRLADIPAPEAKADEVKIRVRAFGLNRAEVYRRAGKMGPIDSVWSINSTDDQSDVILPPS